MVALALRCAFLLADVLSLNCEQQVGSGYSMEQLEDMNARTKGKWHSFDDRSEPLSVGLLYILAC